MTDLRASMLRRPGQGAGNASAPIKRALETAINQQGAELRKRLEVTCAMSPRDAHAFADEMPPLYEYLVQHLMDTWDSDPDDVNAQRLMNLWRNMNAAEKDEHRDLLVEWFAFLAVACTGAAMEGFIAGTIYKREKSKTRKRARQQRPGR